MRSRAYFSFGFIGEHQFDLYDQVSFPLNSSKIIRPDLINYCRLSQNFEIPDGGYKTKLEVTIFRFA